MTTKYPDGIDCVWIATDRAGHLAAFATGGAGPIPQAVLEIAERGIFAYDWSDVHRTRRDEIGAYELIAAPANPIDISRLPQEFADLVASNKLGSIVFDSEKRLDVRKELSCIERP